LKKKGELMDTKFIVFSTSNNVILKLDTTTGKCWERTFVNNEHHWILMNDLDKKPEETEKKK
jgi:hypothetical protein